MFQLLATQIQLMTQSACMSLWACFNCQNFGIHKKINPYFRRLIALLSFCLLRMKLSTGCRGSQ